MICGKKTNNVPVCTNCSRTQYSVKNSLKITRCISCGKELISTFNNCMECREKVIMIHADKVIPLFSYRLWNKELLFLWKMQGIRSLSYFFAKKIYEALTLLEINYVVPVPPRKGKIKENGWDQIDELCRYLEAFWKIKVLYLLERNSSIQQKKLNRENRLEMIENAYSVKSDEEVRKELARKKLTLPEKVCLLDDVCTTGATLESCCKILKELKIKTVYALTLFTVD